jgi:hypothetical protein
MRPNQPFHQNLHHAFFGRAQGTLKPCKAPEIIC